MFKPSVPTFGLVLLGKTIGQTSPLPQIFPQTITILYPPHQRKPVAQFLLP